MDLQAGKEMRQEKQMIKQENFKILCVCCGGKIRDDEHHDASGLCLECFYELLNEQMQTQTISRTGEFVSER